MKNTLIDIVTKSNSLEILRNVNNNIKERHFHEFTHILYDIRTILGKKKINYLEIGSYIGSSASLMLHHTYPTDIYCVDPLILNKSHYNGTLNQYNTLKHNLDKNNINNNKFEILQNYSNNKNLLEKIKELKIDILFIDGCHKYQSVINDFDNYKNKVNKGGFIIFDDYLDYKHSPEVKKAVDYILKNYNLDEYEIIGTIENIKNAFSFTKKTMSNEFILYKNII